MTEPIQDVSALPGTELTDQDDELIGKIEDIYAINGDGRHPMWVTVKARLDDDDDGQQQRRTVFIPLSRIKQEDADWICVPYTLKHLLESPEVQGDGEIPAETEAELRAFYGIRSEERELNTDNYSYTTLVPEEEGPSKRVENPDEIETPDADRRTDETDQRLQDPGPREIRKITAEDIVDEDNTRRPGDERPV